MGRVVKKDAMRFMIECLSAVGANLRAAEQQAELLYEADRNGFRAHGINRIDMYVKDILYGACFPNNKPKILKRTLSTAWVDANSVLGATSSHFAMNLAMRQAKKTGVGWVSVKGGNHFGMAGFWSRKAARNGLIGMAFCNSSPLMAPTRSKKAALGTNPISVIARAVNDDYFAVDMSTTAVALGKIELQFLRGLPLPRGWAVDCNGVETQDASLAYKAKMLMPLGGGERNSGYKGYGLAGAVEIFCGISSGAAYGHTVRYWAKRGPGCGPSNLGHCFVALDPSTFASGFEERLSECMNYWRKLEPADPKLPVLAPGDKERKHAAEVDKFGSIYILQKQINKCALLSKELNVKPIKVIR